MSSKPVAPIILPDAIEAESFRFIESGMGPHDFSVIEWPVVRRAMHSTADCELGRSLVFHPRAVSAAPAATPPADPTAAPAPTAPRGTGRLRTAGPCWRR